MDQEWRREGGDQGGGQRVKMGQRATLILGSGVHQDGLHQEEWGAVVVKLSEDCHHLRTTELTARRENNTISSTPLHSYSVCTVPMIDRNPEPDPQRSRKKGFNGEKL